MKRGGEGIEASTTSMRPDCDVMFPSLGGDSRGSEESFPGSKRLSPTDKSIREQDLFLSRFLVSFYF